MPVLTFALISEGAQAATSLFPEQRILYERTQNEASYLLTLSPIKKVHSEYESDREMYVKGRLKTYTYELEHPYKLESAWREIQSYMENQNASLVFECDGLDCGNSNAWANERFGVKQLYGLDLRQHYQVWQYGDDKVTRFEVLYLIERGNRRVYFQREILIPEDTIKPLALSEEVIAAKFYREKEIMLSGLSFEQGNLTIDKKILEPFARAFNQQSFRKLTVVAYEVLPGTEEQRKIRGLAYGEQVKQALVSLGVRERRINVETELVDDETRKPGVKVELR